MSESQKSSYTSLLQLVKQMLQEKGLLPVIALILVREKVRERGESKEVGLDELLDCTPWEGFGWFFHRILYWNEPFEMLNSLPKGLKEIEPLLRKFYLQDYLRVRGIERKVRVETEVRETSKDQLNLLTPPPEILQVMEDAKSADLEIPSKVEFADRIAEKALAELDKEPEPAAPQEESEGEWAEFLEEPKSSIPEMVIEDSTWEATVPSAGKIIIDAGNLETVDPDEIYGEWVIETQLRVLELIEPTKEEIMALQLPSGLKEAALKIAEEGWSATKG